MTAEKLHGFIWNGLQTVEKNGTLELCLPFFFGDKSEMLTVIWREIKAPKLSKEAKKLRANGHSINCGSDFKCYEINDGGRILREFEKKVGDITPYKKKISDVLNNTGTFELSGGRILKNTYSAESGHSHTYYLSSLLLAASLIMNLDKLTYVDREEYERSRNNA